MGKIILLNTPIGNLGDLTSRVKEALNVGRLFAVEDTRVFKELLNHLGISVQGKKIFSMHDQSSDAEIQKLLDMSDAEDLYVASEAGSPIISDPAYPLVLGAYKRGKEVESFSGVSSPIMALELSGLPPIPFQFHGFLPREESKKLKIFQSTNLGTHIFFEAPTRIIETMEILSKFREDLDVVIVRELSKKFEEVLRFKSGQWPKIKDELMVKGEFILLFYKPDTDLIGSESLKTQALEIINQGASPKLVSKLLAEILDQNSKEIYSKLVSKKGS